MVTDEKLLSEISLMEAHAKSALHIAARLRAALTNKDNATKKKTGLTADQKAQILGKKNKHLKAK